MAQCCKRSQSGAQARIRFLAADTTISLTGARPAIDNFSTRCGVKAAPAALAPAAAPTPAAALAPAAAPAPAAEIQCSGHRDIPDAPGQIELRVRWGPQPYPSPDAAALALVFPVDIDLHATPDMESRVAGGARTEPC